jgi:peptidoglycan/xylan/chitin deacetylase (PgdA/CDA1 family)
MTTITNEEIVAQLYLSVRSIKEATGVTTRCWRPPYGDVDDRVRAIAHQMGLSTIIWDSDSFDWGMPSVANAFQGQYNQSTIDGFFDKWVTDRKSGVDNLHGHVVLEHETSNVTILAAERWLPKLQEAFDVKTVHECAPELPNPYWEE